MRWCRRAAAHLGDAAMTAPEKVMLDSVEKRVGDWREMAPFYSMRNTGGESGGVARDEPC